MRWVYITLCTVILLGDIVYMRSLRLFHRQRRLRAPLAWVLFAATLTILLAIV